MIDGVRIKELRVFNDVVEEGERVDTPGFLMEVVRNDEDLLKQFGQSTFTVAHPGTVKAFHWHTKQDDLWFIASGRALVVLHDLRDGSPTKGETQTIPAGVDDYKVILIPPGVAHGYKVVSEEPVMLFYHTTEPYNANEPDEERIPGDDPTIGYDWDNASV